MECILATLWHSFFVQFVSQYIHYPYISYKFLFRNLFMETCVCSILI